MRSFWQDIRFATRTLAKQPGFTASALATLALGIGATTAMFSVVNGILFQPLPYYEPGRLVRVFETDLERDGALGGVSPPNFMVWQARSHSFESLAVFMETSGILTGSQGPERLEGAEVSASLFPMLGADAMLGRTLLPYDDQEGAERVVVLSQGLWEKRFGSDPEVLGARLTLNDSVFTVIGVMPANFAFPEGAEYWAPAAHELAGMLDVHGARILALLGRLAPGTDLRQAQLSMDQLVAQIATDIPENAGHGVALVRLQEVLTGDVRPALLILSAAVGLVLLISVANAANLLLARAMARSREIALRAALGAGRSRLLRQLLTESLALGLAAGVVGLLLAFWALDLIVALGPRDLPRVEMLVIDSTVLGFTVGISLLVGAVFGLVPALHASRNGMGGSLRMGEADLTQGHRGSRLRRLLIVGEIAMTLVLLVGTGLMINSFTRLVSVDPGFQPDHVVTMEIALPQFKYAEHRQQAAFFEDLIARIEGLPAVDTVGATTSYPLSGANMSFAFSKEDPSGENQGEMFPADYRAVSPGYFRSLEIPVIDGRDFSAFDRGGARDVVIVNATLARRYWPDESALGKRLRITFREREPREIIGVVGDVKHAGLDSAVRPEMFVPFQQHPWSFMRLTINTSTEVGAVAAILREQVWAIDDDQPIGLIRPLNDVLSESVSQPRFYTLLFGLFGTAALLLAVLGVYGVVSHTVARRTREIGLRGALGAQERDLMRPLLVHGMTPVLAGVGLGLVSSIAVTRIMASLLFEVTATDPTTYVLVAAFMIAVSLAAILVPARRAMHVDPMVALRSE